MNSKELVDIYDKNKNKTGKIKVRHKDTLEVGEYVIGIQAIIMNSNNQILISQRSEQTEETIFLKTAKSSHRFKEIYLFKRNLEVSELSFADGEVVAAKWVDIEEFMNMLNNGEIVSNVDFDDMDYAKCLILLKSNCTN